MHNVFIPPITDSHMCSADERLLLSLPVIKKGGMTIPFFSAVADLEFANSCTAGEQLFEHINNQESIAPVDSEQIKTSRRRIANNRGDVNNTILQQLCEMSLEQLRANDLAKMKGALSWLTTLPLTSENFDLKKRNSTMRSALGTAGH